MGRDLVVIGAGLGGLSAAIHARLRGWNVLVLEQAEAPGGKARGITIGAFQLDPGPSIIILPRIYEEVFRCAGRRMEDYLQFERLDTITRVFFEGQDPLDLPADESACMARLGDLAGQDAQSLGALLDQIAEVEPLLWKTVFAKPFRTPLDLLNPKLMRFGLKFDPRKSFRQSVDERFQSDLAKAFFYGFPSYGGQSYNTAAPGGFLIPYYMLRDGVYFPRGGVRAIPSAFARLATELGVEFRFKTRVTGIERTGRSAAAVQVGSERLPCDAVICNLDRSTAGQWLGRQESRPPSYSYFTMHWGFQREVPGLDHHNLFVPTTYAQGFERLYSSQLPKDPIVYLNATAARDDSAAPAGGANLFAVVSTPAMVDSIDWTRPALAAKVKASLTRRGIDLADPVFERVQTPLTFFERDGNYRGSLYGLDERHRLFGMFPQANNDPELNNLFYCGGSVQPGAGLPMVTLSGQFAADPLPG